MASGGPSEPESEAGTGPLAWGWTALRVPNKHPPSSGGVLVFVEGSAESISSVDVQVSDLSWIGGRFGQRAERLGAGPGAG